MAARTLFANPEFPQEIKSRRGVAAALKISCRGEYCFAAVLQARPRCKEHVRNILAPLALGLVLVSLIPC